MFWTAIWFIVNLLFVASAIVYLFMHRTVTEASRQGADAERMNMLKRRRKAAAAISIIMFVSMCASFVMNMKING